MSLTKKWYTIDQAVSRFAISAEQLQAWVDRGLVRNIEDNNRMLLLNGDDIERELGLISSV